MDEADRLLDLDFGPVIDKILKVIPREQRHTYLFSATMTTKVAKLQRASLRDPVKLEVSSKFVSPSRIFDETAVNLTILPCPQLDTKLFRHFFNITY